MHSRGSAHRDKDKNAIKGKKTYQTFDKTYSLKTGKEPMAMSGGRVFQSFIAENSKL